MPTILRAEGGRLHAHVRRHSWWSCYQVPLVNEAFACRISYRGSVLLEIINVTYNEKVDHFPIVEILFCPVADRAIEHSNLVAAQAKCERLIRPRFSASQSHTPKATNG